LTRVSIHGLPASLRLRLHWRIDGDQSPPIFFLNSIGTDIHGEKIFAAIENAQFATLDAAHLAPVEAPEAFCGTLNRFFSDVSGGINPD